MEKKYFKLKDKYKFQDLTISVETPKGTYRHWYDPNNDEKGKTLMNYDYGYFTYSDVKDSGDSQKLDCYVGPNEYAENVYVVHQMKRPDFQEEDELKVMIGFESKKDATQAYLMHYNNDKFFGGIDELSITDFKEKYVNKALPEQSGPMGEGAPSPKQPPKAPPKPGGPAQQGSMMDPMLMIDPFDMNNPDSVKMQLRQIGNAKDKDLAKLAKEIWGEGYQYQTMTESFIRAELRGWLQDQSEYLTTIHPALIYQDVPQMPASETLPHSSNYLQNSPSGNAQPNNQNSNEVASTETTSAGSSIGAY